ncbi:MAG: DUF5615 family PIN-like protein [Saprospiraceae bacterium]
MKLLIDANISWRLKEILSDYFLDCAHVESCGLNYSESDIEIWKFVAKNEFFILTNNYNFINLVGYKYVMNPKKS